MSARRALLAGGLVTVLTVGLWLAFGAGEGDRGQRHVEPEAGAGTLRDGPSLVGRTLPGADHAPVLEGGRPTSDEVPADAPGPLEVRVLARDGTPLEGLHIGLEEGHDPNGDIIEAWNHSTFDPVQRATTDADGYARFVEARLDKVRVHILENAIGASASQSSLRPAGRDIAWRVPEIIRVREYVAEAHTNDPVRIHRPRAMAELPWTAVEEAPGAWSWLCWTSDVRDSVEQAGIPAGYVRGFGLAPPCAHDLRLCAHAGVHAGAAPGGPLAHLRGRS